MNEHAGEKLYLVYLKAVIRGTLLSVVLLLLSALLFYFTGLGDGYLGSVVWIATILGICYSGIYGANRIGSRGILHGALLGIIYIAVLVCVGLLAETGDINYISYGIMLAMGIIVGGMSGIIGTNLARSRNDS